MPEICAIVEKSDRPVRNLHPFRLPSVSTTALSEVACEYLKKLPCLSAFRNILCVPETIVPVVSVRLST